MTLKAKNNIAVYLFAALTLSACSQPVTTTPSSTAPAGFPATLLPTELNAPGTYHVVQNGETLWRIAKQYGQQLPDILKYNPHLDITDVSVGSKIFIPNATEKNIIAPTPSAAFSHSPHSSTHSHITDPPENLPVDDGRFHWPVKGKLRQRFGKFNDGFRSKGIIISARENTKIRAPKSGTVILVADHFAGLGRCVVINHGDIWSIYGHLKSVAVNKDSQIRQGQSLGTTSGKSDGLYLEIRRNGRSVDPMDFLP
jgi:murein DD-endopeptidase MepM/ murein hydrolase activator NlpD